MLNAGQDEITSIYQSYWVFSLLFSEKNLNKAQNNIYGNLLPVISTEGYRLEKK